MVKRTTFLVFIKKPHFIIIIIIIIIFTGAASSEETRLIRIHRRNSDSSLYCKTRYAEALKQPPVSSERPPNSQSRLLDQEKVAFVQSYLEKAEDARSRVAETSDSGISGTHGTPSEFMVEETSGKQTPY